MTLETKTIGFGNPLFRRKKAKTESISFSAVYKLSRESKIYSLKTIKLKEAPSHEGICQKLFGRAFPDDIAVVYKALNAVPEVPNAEEWQQLHQKMRNRKVKSELRVRTEFADEENSTL